MNIMSNPNNIFEQAREKTALKAALLIAAGTLALSACGDGNEAPVNTTTSVEQSATPSPTQSAEAINPQDLLPNPEVVRATLDETEVQIPYREDYTASELAILSADQIVNIRQLLNNNQELLVDNYDKWTDAQWDATGDYQSIDYLRPLTQVLSDVAKDNVISENYVDNLQPDDFDFMSSTMGTVLNVLENERVAMHNDTEYSITYDIFEGSEKINYADDGTIYVSYVFFEKTSGVNGTAETSTKFQTSRQFEVGTNKDGEQILRMVSMELDRI